MAGVRQTNLNKQHIVITSTGGIAIESGAIERTSRSPIRVLSDIVLSPSSTKRNSFGDNKIPSRAEEVIREVKPGPIEKAEDYINLDHSYALRPGTHPVEISTPQTSHTHNATTSSYIAHYPLAEIFVCLKKSRKRKMPFVWNSLY